MFYLLSINFTGERSITKTDNQSGTLKFGSKGRVTDRANCVTTFKNLQRDHY